MSSVINNPVDGEQLRTIMRRVASPVVVVSAIADGEFRGMTAGSFVSVSLDPPLICFNVGKESRMHGILTSAEVFAVHILAANQEHLSNLFARSDLDGVEQFASCAHRVREDGLPVLVDSLGVLHCSKHAKIDAGDHSIFLGKVQATEDGRNEDPLVYYNRSYRSVTDGTQQS